MSETDILDAPDLSLSARSVVRVPSPRVLEGPLTYEEFLALPEDDDVDRMLVRGALWEKPFRWRDARHARVLARLSALIEPRREGSAERRGSAYSRGYVLLRRDPDTFVDLDLTYFAEGTGGDGEFLQGTPTLVAEIASPDETFGEHWARLEACIEACVPHVWSIDTYFRTVTVHRPGSAPRLLSGDEKLSAEPHLPGFAVPVSKLFER